MQTMFFMKHIIADCIQKSKSLLYKNFIHSIAKISKMSKKMKSQKHDVLMPVFIRWVRPGTELSVVHRTGIYDRI